MWSKTIRRILGVLVASLAVHLPVDARAQAAAVAISGQPAATALVGQDYRFEPSVTGGRNSRRFFIVRGKPGWASFNWRSGALTGRPATSQVGDYTNIRISVTDGRSSASLPPFSIKVTSGSSTPTNRAPVLSGAAATTATTGTAWAFQPTASDPDGDMLSFSVQGKPVWATFSTTSGRLSGTPSATDVGTSAAITIMASDGKTMTGLPPFSIRVVAATTTPTNTPPTISGSPATNVLVGQPYNFQPTGADRDGDKIAFGISNKPAWATFDTATGRLAGTPAAADVGTYANVAIAVSDSKASATLPPFGIVVASVTNGSATLNWSAPTRNTDGSALTNLAGYRIQYGTNPALLSQTIVVANPSLTTYVVENLVPGVWYFALTAYDSTGASSASTGTANKTLP